MNRRMFLACAFATLLAGGCSRGAREESRPAARDGRLRVIATTQVVADLVRELGGDRVDVTSWMGPGVDPHGYEPSPGDLERLVGADLAFSLGLSLEERASDTLARAAAEGHPAFAVAGSIDPSRLLRPAALGGAVDPHVWLDASLWSSAVRGVVEVLASAEPDSRLYFEENARIYREKLAELDEWCRSEIALIPAERRVLITAHDAFGYFGRAYGVDTVGLEGPAPDVPRIVDLVRERGVPAVFSETSMSRGSVDAVVEAVRAVGGTLAASGPLYSDAMGPAGTPAATYPGMMRANVEAITEALQ
ncbi:MAG: zinc ABC transporter substrate-binding protein [Gemmatimonadetes bacterium]|nr:zinc ABC transporter substrate-binding protein [Gemmatimonadota bacterium]